MSDIFYPIETAEKMIAEFEDCSLPLSEWDHGKHLVVGLYITAQYEDAAYDEIKKRLLKYNNCFQKNGYHETMTRFWIAAILHFRGTNGKTQWTQFDLDELIFDDNLTRRNLWTDYYSKELMMSEAAREGYLPPDIKDL